MQTIAVSQFKTHSLRILSEVSNKHEAVLITKRGKPLAEIIPFTPPSNQPGRLAQALLFEKDILSPLGEELWSSCR